MALGSLLLLLDDISVVLDDVALMTKVAAKKTAGVLGDDLALNAQQMLGIHAKRELPVVFAVAKGSAINKLILLPLALLLSYLSILLDWPLLVTLPLMIGGAYLCFEGVEKVLHRWLPHDEGDHDELLDAASSKSFDMVQFEKQRIKGAIRTDFILSAEIMVIALGTVEGQPLIEQAAVLALIAALMTIGVYGLVALIVKMDDAGLWLTTKKTKVLQILGRGLVSASAPLMKLLGWVGTVAMFLVGGGIIAHNISLAHHLHEDMTHLIGSGLIQDMGFNLAVGFVVGLAVLALVSLIKWTKSRFQ